MLLDSIIRLFPPILFSALLGGFSSCGRPKEPSLTTNGTVASANQGDLAGKTRFLRRYFKPARTFEQLEYEVSYQDNSGGRVPGPSDWDIRIIATVPANELASWIPGGATTSQQKRPDWIKPVAGEIPVDHLDEWYVNGSTLVGLDRKNRTVAYWNTTFGLNE
ncbi:MAG: hypothetical protein AAF514_06810 [Verrucomicrobiota bacterium]